MNKLSYDEALKQLKQLEVRQRAAKNIISRQGKFQFLVRSRQKVINENKPVINLLLSIIHAHKTARKLYAENYRLKQMVKESNEFIKDNCIGEFFKALKDEE